MDGDILITDGVTLVTVGVILVMVGDAQVGVILVMDILMRHLMLTITAEEVLIMAEEITAI
jgi:hypothetical protein